MERDTLEHLLGRVRTDVRLQGLCGVEAAGDLRERDRVGFGDTADAVLRWAGPDLDGEDGHPQAMWR